MHAQQPLGSALHLNSEGGGRGAGMGPRRRAQAGRGGGRRLLGGLGVCGGGCFQKEEWAVSRV
jgi:hypothetical protein